MLENGGGTQPLKPFLKWPGGKRWLAEDIGTLILKRLSGRYFEPFLGGGAVFFHVRPKNSALSDVNSDLINTYCVVRDSPLEVADRLRRLETTEESYYNIRSSRPRTSLTKAVRFLYLNRTAFGGIHRLNLRGEFNVPYGGGERTPAALWETDILIRASDALKDVELRDLDFEIALDSARKGDVVYCDPTYSVAHYHNGFVRYNERNFSWSDQIRLAKASHLASSRGATVIISNANHESIHELYRGARITTIDRCSVVSRDPSKRRRVSEYLILLESKVNY